MSDPQQTRGLGRRPDPDERDQRYLMRAMQPSEQEAPLVGLRVYRRGQLRDQGSTGTCVGHGWRAWMDGEPLRSKAGPDPFGLYDLFIVNDQWTDNDVDPDRQFGTSVRAGAKVLMNLGHIKSYVWAFNIDDVRRWVLSGQGGVVLGIDWTSDMFSPSPEGVIRARGAVQGGHCVYLFGADDRQGLVYIQNSWGKEWGGWPHSRFNHMQIYRGCALLPYEDLDLLLRRQGEACTAVQMRVSS
jgi:hypothetical protein